MQSNFTVVPSLRDFLHILFKRKKQILVFFCSTVIVVGFATILPQPKYEAKSQILVKMGRENVYMPEITNAGNMSAVVRYDREEQINSEIEILTSQTLIEDVVESLGATRIYEGLNTIQEQESRTEEAVSKFQENLNVEGINNSNVIEVSFKHTTPEVASAAVNELIRLFLDRHLDVHKRPQSSKFFQDQSQSLKEKLEQREGELRNFKKSHNISALDEQRSFLLRQEGDLRAELDKTSRYEVETINRIAQLRQQLTTTPKTIPQEGNIDQNMNLISTLQTRLVELELEEKELLNKYTEQSRLVVSIRDDIQMVREKLAEQERKRYFGPNTTYQRLQEDLLSYERDLKALNAKRETLLAQLEGYQEELEEMNRIEVEYNRLQDKIEVDRQNYRLYLGKLEESRIFDAMDTEKIANVTQIQPAYTPRTPVSPRVALNLVLGIFLGAFGGIGLAFFREYNNERIDRREVAEDVLGLPVLGSIPLLGK